jgi:hypothetical protein
MPGLHPFVLQLGERDRHGSYQNWSVIMQLKSPGSRCSARPGDDDFDWFWKIILHYIADNDIGAHTYSAGASARAALRRRSASQ